MTFGSLCVVYDDAAADPLSVRAVSRLGQFLGSDPRVRAAISESPAPAHGALSKQMTALLIILFLTVGLAVRAVTYTRQWSPAESESANDTGFVDTCTRTFVLVLMSLLGLLALGLMYGNVLGSANASP